MIKNGVIKNLLETLKLGYQKFKSIKQKLRSLEQSTLN